MARATVDAPSPAASLIRVFVVDDRPKILKNQLHLFEGQQDIDIVSTALSGETTPEEVPELMPEVLLLGMGLPRMSGIDIQPNLARRLLRHFRMDPNSGPSCPPSPSCPLRQQQGDSAPGPSKAIRTHIGAISHRDHVHVAY
jgi:hypothetical protein